VFTTAACTALATVLATGCSSHAADSSSGATVGVGATACSLSAPTPPDWRLHADGIVLRDSLGRTVFLRGVNAGGRSKFAPFAPFDFATDPYATALGAYMDRAASWGIDAMRVPFTWEALEPTQGSRDASWLARYQQLVDAAWARGIWTILDFHQDLYSQSFCGDGFPPWTVPNAPPSHHDCSGWQLHYFSDMPMQQAFDAFWAAGSPVQAGYLAAWDFLIARFKDEPGVVGFEPINEPGWGTAQDVGAFEATTLSSFYAQVAPHMRQLAPQSLVFVEPTGISGSNVSTKLTRPPGDGIVFAPHYYPVREVPDTAETSLTAWAAVGAAWNVPTFLGEFGISNGGANAVDYVASCLGALDTLGLSGTAWEYSVAAENWNGETFSFVAADGTEYPVAKALVRPFARAVAGDAIAQSWDPASSTFTLAYVPAAGITEVELPARAYPSGFDVVLSGGCYDQTSSPGRLLVKADDHATVVSLRVTSR
jgi:endoglycosylceramidase